MKKIRIGLVGAGFMGRTHSAAYKSVNNIFGDEVVPELVVVADVNEENAKAVAEKYGYQRWTTDWHEIMDDTAIARSRFRRQSTASMSIVKSPLP